MNILKNRSGGCGVCRTHVFVVVLVVVVFCLFVLVSLELAWQSVLLVAYSYLFGTDA